MEEIVSEMKKDMEYLAQARFHEIVGRAYLYAALLGKGDSFHASLTDSIAPEAARIYVSSRLKELIPLIEDLDIVDQVNFTTDTLIEVVLK